MLRAILRASGEETMEDLKYTGDPFVQEALVLAIQSVPRQPGEKHG